MAQFLLHRKAHDNLFEQGGQDVDMPDQQ